MYRQDKQLPSPPPEALSSPPMSSSSYGSSRHMKDSSSSESIAKTSTSSLVKRDTYGSATHTNPKTVDLNDDLLIRIMAQHALSDLPDNTAILHPDEVEDLKNELSMVQGMIESTKRKLLLEQKVRQAAQSLNRLENAANKRQRISDSTAHTHLSTAQKKCDEINAELWRLSALATDLERKLAQHNAAVLGLGMSILEKRAMENGHADEFGEGHLYASNEAMDDNPRSSRFSLSERRTSINLPAPSVDLTETQSRLTAIISTLTTEPTPPLPPSTPLPDLLTTLEQRLSTLHSTHAQTLHTLTTTQTDTSRQLDLLRLRERDQSAAITDVTARNDDLDRRLRQTQREFDRVQNELDEADELLESLRGDVTRAKEEARIAETAAAGREAESLKREKSLRRSETERFRAELAAKELLLREMVRERDELRGKLEMAEQTAESLQMRYTTTVRGHESTVQTLETQLVVLKSENATLKSERDEILGSRQQRAEEARLQRELEEQRAAFAKSAQSQEMLVAELDRARRRNSQLVKDLQFAEEERASTEASLSRQIAALENQMEKDSPVSPMSVGSESAKERELESRCEDLQSELSSILDDFERLTSQFIDHESFRTTLEAQVDGLRAQCHGLQTELAEERVRMLGRHGEASPFAGGEATSTVTLRREFRKMVAELRAEHIGALKGEYDERRRLEGIIREMKKDKDRERYGKGG